MSDVKTICLLNSRSLLPTRAHGLSPMKFNSKVVKDAIAEMQSGAKFAMQGARHVSDHPALLLWGLWPATLQFVALLVAVRLSFWEGATWIEAILIQLDLGIFPDPTEHTQLPQPILDLQQSAFNFISFIGATILFALLTLLGLLVAIFFSAPAMHAMASRVECTLDATPASELPPIAWVEPMQRSGMGLISWVLGQIVFLPLQLFPVFGGMLETTMGLGWSSLVMGRELVDGALAARGLTFPQQVRVVWSQRTKCGALGLLGSLTLWIPLVNVVAFPSLVTGATLWVRDLSEEELNPQPKSEPPDTTSELS